MKNFGLYKRNRFWWVHFEVKGVAVHKSTKCTNEEDAEEVAARWYNDLAKESQGIWVDRGHTVKQIWDSWWEGTKPPILSDAHRERVKRDWVTHILPRFGHLPASAITDKDAEDLRRAYLDAPSLRQAHQAEERLANLRRKSKGKPVALPPAMKRSLAGANKLLLHFHLVFSYAVTVERQLQAVPWSVRVIDVQAKPKAALAQAQVKPFLAQVDASGSTHVRIAVRAMLYLALREDESLAMRWEWFSSDLLTFQHGDRKAKDAPSFAVPEDLRRLLKAIQPKNASGLVLPADDGAPHRQQFTRKTIARAGLALGLKLTPHSLRHSWATMTARSTGNAHLIKRGLGHKTLAMSEQYVHLNTQDLDQAGRQVFGDLWAPPAESKPAHVVRKFKVTLKNKQPA